MVRDYVRTTVHSYSPTTLKKCIEAVETNKMKMSKASKHFGVPYSTLRDKIKKTHEKKSGGQLALSEQLEKKIADSLDLLATWKVPFAAFEIQGLNPSAIIAEAI